MKSPLISLGPTVQFGAVHRFATSLHLAGPPTLNLISLGPTVQFGAVHRFAASSHLAGPPTLDLEGYGCGTSRFVSDHTQISSGKSLNSVFGFSTN